MRRWWSGPGWASALTPPRAPRSSPEPTLGCGLRVTESQRGRPGSTGSTTRATEGSTRGRSSYWPRADHLALLEGRAPMTLWRAIQVWRIAPCGATTSVTPLLTSATWRRSDAIGRPTSATEWRSDAIDVTVAPRGQTPREPPTTGGSPHTIAAAQRTIG